MSTAEILDLPTLAAVHREVDARAADWRAAWRMHGPGSPAANAMFDQRLVRAEELDRLGRWLAEREREADESLALGFREQAEQLPLTAVAS